MSLWPTRLGIRVAALVCGLLAGPFAPCVWANITVPSAQYPTIQSAINAVLSGSVADGTEIDVQPGTYPEALSIANTARSLKIRGVAGARATIVDALGKGAAAVKVFRATGNIEFRGLTFRRGVVGGTITGGGFFIQESSPSFLNCVFEQSSAYDGGGGALVASDATFAGCTIQQNTAARFGGGVHMSVGSRPVFTATDIIGNRSGAGGAGIGNKGAGGGVFSHDSSPTFRGGHIDGNVSNFAAGGVFHMGISPSTFGRAMLLIEDAEIANNVSNQYPGEPNPAEGGGIHVEDNATATLTRVRVTGNRAGTGGGLNAYRARYDVTDAIIDGNQATAGFGGGVAASSNNATAQLPASVINLTTTLVRNNAAPMGAGVAIVGDDASAQRASLSVANSVVSGNQSQSQGGGILANHTVLTASGSLVIDNTVTGGGMPVGGGIAAILTSSVTVNSTTIAHNRAASLGGGIFVNDTSTINVAGSNVYDNTAGDRGAGLFIGGGSSGTIQNNMVADNTAATAGQINEDTCTSVIYPNNLITPTAFTASCGSISSRAPGTDSISRPRFAVFLAVPSAGTSTTLAWSVARATSVTIAGVGTFAASTGTTDVAASGSTTFTLTASASSADGGDYGPVTMGFTFAPPPPPVFSARAVDGDFDGDRKTDVTVFRPSNGTWYILKSGTSFSGADAHAWGASTDTPVPADYDGDGSIDVTVYRSSSGHWFIRTSSSGYASSLTYQWGTPGDIPVPGDYDGDGKADLAVYRPSNGTWYILQSSTGFVGGAAYAWGAGADVPVLGDFDGDGRLDIAVYRPSSGHWFIRQSTTNYATSITYQWGTQGDVPVGSDYDGDGKTDLAIYRPSNGTWYVLLSGSGFTAGAGYSWGAPGDVPMPGDFDGDGKTDVVVFRPSTAHWFILKSSTGYTSWATYQWGSTGDLPVVSGR